MPRTFETERTGRVLTLRFDNPPLNFMNRVMVGELDELLDSLEDDRSLGAVVITGKPEGMFITHYDHNALPGDQHFDPCQRVFQHGTSTNHGAELLDPPPATLV